MVASVNPPKLSITNDRFNRYFAFDLDDIQPLPDNFKNLSELRAGLHKINCEALDELAVESRSEGRVPINKTKNNQLRIDEQIGQKIFCCLNQLPLIIASKDDQYRYSQAVSGVISFANSLKDEFDLSSKLSSMLKKAETDELKAKIINVFFVLHKGFQTGNIKTIVEHAEREYEGGPINQALCGMDRDLLLASFTQVWREDLEIKEGSATSGGYKSDTGAYKGLACLVSQRADTSEVIQDLELKLQDTSLHDATKYKYLMLLINLVGEPALSKLRQYFLAAHSMSDSLYDIKGKVLRTIRESFEETKDNGEFYLDIARSPEVTNTVARVQAVKDYSYINYADKDKIQVLQEFLTHDQSPSVVLAVCSALIRNDCEMQLVEAINEEIEKTDSSRILYIILKNSKMSDEDWDKLFGEEFLLSLLAHTEDLNLALEWFKDPNKIKVSNDMDFVQDGERDAKAYLMSRIGLLNVVLLSTVGFGNKNLKINPSTDTEMKMADIFSGNSIANIQKSARKLLASLIIDMANQFKILLKRYYEQRIPVDTEIKLTDLLTKAVGEPAVLD